VWASLEPNNAENVNEVSSVAFTFELNGTSQPLALNMPSILKFEARTASRRLNSLGQLKNEG
jgi:hypothetical protein